MGYRILNYDIELVSEFGLCYKNKLPEELQKDCLQENNGWRKDLF